MSKKARNEKLKDRILELAKTKPESIDRLTKMNRPKYSKDYYSHFP